MTSKYRVRVCSECKTKRRIFQVHSPDPEFHRYRCSKGHEWDIEIPTLAKLSVVLQNIYAPMIRDFLSQPSAIWATIGRNK